jgi:hypothetical protein
LGDEARLYEIVSGCALEPAETLLRCRLDAETLEALGYSRHGLTRMGYGEEKLTALGFAPAAPPPAWSAPPPEPEDGRHDAHGAAPGTGVARYAIQEADADESDAGGEDEDRPAGQHDIRALIDEGHTASELRAAGILVRECKAAGIKARDLMRIGFALSDLAPEFGGSELRAIGFRPHELRHLYDGAQMRHFGFTAQEMRMAGYTAHDLLGFGYSQNQVHDAGFATQTVAREVHPPKGAGRKKFHGA